MDLGVQTERIERKIGFLSEKIKNLRAENVLLQLTIKDLRAEAAEQNTADSVNKTHKSEAVQSVSHKLMQNESAVREIKEQLNQYIDELDEIIRMLKEI